MCHVLIIEDEQLIALDIEDILAREGATSFEIVDTEQAAVRAADARRPDLITADMELRSGFGSSAVATITGKLGPIPVIFITGTPDACRAGEMTRVLNKPVDETAVSRAYHALRDAA